MSYRDVFDEAIGGTPPIGFDVDRIIHRERRRAGLRPLLAAAAVVLVTGAAAVAAGGSGRQAAVPPADPAATPTAGPEVRGGFPEYLDGTRIVAGDTAPLTDGSITLEFTVPAPWAEFVLFVRCERTDLERAPSIIPLPIPLLPLDLTLSPTEMARFPCEDSTYTDPPGAPPDARPAVGERHTMTLRVAGVPESPVTGTFGVAAGFRVPFDGYGFPPAPDPVPDLDTTIPPVQERLDSEELATMREAGVVLPDSEARTELHADPSRPMRAVLEWPGPGGFHLLLRSDRPNAFEVRIDGSVVAPTRRGPVAVWDYDQELGWYEFTVPELDLEPGQPVRIEVIPRVLAGEWMAVLEPVPTEPPE
jgi:hypothetical protein